MLQLFLLWSDQSLPRMSIYMDMKPSTNVIPSTHQTSKVAIVLFGLTLIELCFGKTLAEMHSPEDGDPNEATTEMKTAYRLHNSVYSEMGTSYGDVVRRCLCQLFDVRDMSLDNEELQQKVFDEIVAPLSDDLMNFNGKSRIK